MLKKLRIPIRIKITNKKKAKAKKQGLTFPPKIKKFILSLIILILLIFSIDLGTFLYFNTQVLAYSSKEKILVTKGDVAKRLFQISKYTSTNLQQLINDVAIQQLVTTQAKKNKKFITKKQVIERLEKEGTKNPSAELIRSAQVILNIEQMLDKKPKPVTEKEIEDFYNANKKIAFDKKSLKDVKDDIRKYLEAQKKQALIMEWVQEKLKNSKLTYTNESKDSKYHFGKGLYLLKTIIIPYLFTK